MGCFSEVVGDGAEGGDVSAAGLVELEAGLLWARTTVSGGRHGEMSGDFGRCPPFSMDSSESVRGECSRVKLAHFRGVVA